MSNKLLTDVAGILAELGVSYVDAEGIAEILYDSGILPNSEFTDWIDLASNAPKQGECCA